MLLRLYSTWKVEASKLEEASESSSIMLALIPMRRCFLPVLVQHLLSHCQLLHTAFSEKCTLFNFLLLYFILNVTIIYVDVKSKLYFMHEFCYISTVLLIIQNRGSS